MQARIRVTGEGAEAAVAGLAEWFGREEEFRGRIVRSKPEVAEGEMGGAANVLIVALGAQGTGTVLATSLVVWLKHRRPSVEIEVTGPEGTTKVRAVDVPGEQLETVLRRVLGE